jgi:2-C-methyl-D-erythritol 4-phosphate cytidylyltransferase
VTALVNPGGDVAVIVAAAGSGLRLGPGPPKALRPLRGDPLLVHAVRRLASCPEVGCVVVAAPPGHEERVRDLVGPRAVVVRGGAQRRDSVLAALAAVPERFGIVLVHDAARAFTPPALVSAVAAAVRAGHDAVIPVLPVVDTITQVGSAGEVLGTLDRAGLRAVQTPQGFRRAVLAAAHGAGSAAQVTEAGHPATDDAGLVEKLGVRVHTVAGSELAFKITTPRDFAVAELLLGA